MILTCTKSEQASSVHLTDSLSTLSPHALQYMMAAFSVQQTLVSVLIPMKGKLDIIPITEWFKVFNMTFKEIQKRKNSQDSESNLQQLEWMAQQIIPLKDPSQN